MSEESPAVVPPSMPPTPEPSGTTGATAAGRPLLALCMIVRDAEKTIVDLLNSVIDTGFDEFIFVDTGSVDTTREIIEGLFNSHLAPLHEDDPPARFPRFEDGDPAVGAPAAVARGYEMRNYERNFSAVRQVRVTLARFRWVNDFSAARNYSFSLTAAKWIMWLDADDILFEFKPGALRKGIERLDHVRVGIKTGPKPNCVTMVYRYAPTLTQRKQRILNMEDSPWVWRGEIHEDSLPAKGPRVHSEWLESQFHVKHNADEEHFKQSFERNKAIAQGSYEKAMESSDPAVRSLASFHMGEITAHNSDLATSEAHFIRAVEEGRGLYTASLSAAHLAKLYMQLGRLDEAAERAAQAMHLNPESRSGVGLLALIEQMRGALPRACLYFDMFFKMKETLDAGGAQPLLTTDRAIIEGVIPAQAVIAYIDIGRLEDALRLFKAIPHELMVDGQVERAYFTARGHVMRAAGVKLVKELVDYYVWASEPLLAQSFLRSKLPAPLLDSAELYAIQRDLRERTAHLDSWAKYEKAYANGDFHPLLRHDEARIARLGRCLRAVEWAKGRQPPLFEVDRVLAIGATGGGCIIERMMLEANPHFHLTIADVDVEHESIKALQTQFPGRVSVHQVKDMVDWPDRKFDLITLFEVLEHVEDPTFAISELGDRLDVGGTLLISVPDGRQYIEPPWNASVMPNNWFRHVRAYTPETLYLPLRGTAPNDARVSIESIGHVAQGQPQWNLLATVQRGEHKRRYPSWDTPAKVAWFCPSGGLPFDPRSLTEGHVGGSEEAAIQLPASLAEIGYDVTVYAPKPQRDFEIEYWNGVRWKDVGLFNPLEADREGFNVVVFWRCPQVTGAPWFEEIKSRAKTVLHCEDFVYMWGGSPDGKTPPAEYYKRFDAVTVLTEAHGKALAASSDAFEGPTVLLPNGINPEDFPAPDESKRDLKKVVYISSPDRGLDHLLNVWPAVRDQVPDATLDVYYDWTLFRRAAPEWAERLTAKLEELKESGVRYLGGVGYPVLHKALREASVWAYPYHDGGTETFCTASAKAMAAGCLPLTTRSGSLPEVIDPIIPLMAPPKWSEHMEAIRDGDFTPFKEFEAEYTRQLVNLLTPSREPEAISEARAHIRQFAIRTWTWEMAAYKFHDIVLGLQKGPGESENGDGDGNQVGSGDGGADDSRDGE